MCCFAAPAATLAVISIAKKKVPEKYHIEWLVTMLWGGVLMLIVEHIAHGEIVPSFPFFSSGWSEIWPEIVRVGIPMTFFILIVWASMVLGLSIHQNKRLSRQGA